MHDPIAKTGAWVNGVLKGHMNYFAVSGNDPSLWWSFTQVKWHWLRSLRRRSQRAHLNWERYIRLVDRFLPPIRILHPLPCHRRRQNPREEPGALAAHAGICAGGGRRRSSLPRPWACLERMNKPSTQNFTRFAEAIASFG